MGRGNMNWSRLTLICLASCSFCLALPLADSAAEAEAVADAEAEARYGAYGGYYRTSARAGRRYSGHHGHYSHYGAHRGHNIQRYGYTFKGPIKAPAFKGPVSAAPTEELERFLDLRKSGRPAIRLGSSIGTPTNTIVGNVEQNPSRRPVPSTIRRPAPVSRRPAPAPVSRRPPPPPPPTTRRPPSSTSQHPPTSSSSFPKLPQKTARPLLCHTSPPSQQWCQLYKQCLQCQASQWQQVSLLLLAYLSSCRCQLCPLFFLRISSAYSPQLTSSVNQSVCLC